MSKWDTNKEIQIFREYLQIPSVHPDINYEPCVEFLKRQANDLKLPVVVYDEGHLKKPVIVITWAGTQPVLPSIMLNSHMDVVPAFEEHWTHSPFAAEIDEDGKIFARGSQDMKNVGMQYLAAIRALMENNITLKRTVHVVFVPDEEVNTEYGMEEFVRSPEFKTLNIGFALDEGAATRGDFYAAFYAERSCWSVYFNCLGTTGHGSMFHSNTAGEKVRFIIDKFMDYRAEQIKKLDDNPKMLSSQVTSVNLTFINGGVQINVIPSSIKVGFDVRIAIDVDHEEFENMLKGWCEEAGGDVELILPEKFTRAEPTKVDDTNLFWVAFKDAIANELKSRVIPVVFPAHSDSHHIRAVGIPAIGFTPLSSTPMLAHDHDEYITAEKYLEGIEVYKQILLKVANV